LILFLIAVLSTQFEISSSKGNLTNNISKTISNNGFKKCTKKFSFKKCYRTLDNMLYEYIFTNQTRIKYIDYDFNHDSVGIVSLTWNKDNYGEWAIGCDFFGYDIINAKKREECTDNCRQTVGCTHYSWNINGTCKLMKGKPSKSKATIVDSDFTCGILLNIPLIIVTNNSTQSGKIYLNIFISFTLI
jgi:hypothetical protein